MNNKNKTTYYNDKMYFIDKAKTITNLCIINNFVGGLSFHKANVLNYLLLATTYSEDEPELICDALKTAHTSILNDNVRQISAFKEMLNELTKLKNSSDFKKRKGTVYGLMPNIRTVNEDLRIKLESIDNYDAINNKTIKLLIVDFYKFCLNTEFCLSWKNFNSRYGFICIKIEKIIKEYTELIDSKKLKQQPLSFFQKIKNLLKL